MTTNEKNELISRLQSATGLSADDKAALTRLLRTQQYGLVWEEKPEDVEELLRTQMPVLTEVKEKAIISDDPQAPDHILIEGDNLEALNALAYTHEGKIDVIYIDPPYNTGNKDFVYNDSFVDVEDGYRHSKWLSFMDKRLRLAKKLLSDKGVIFISIDDNEQANLKLLCDEVFGESNFVANVIWKHTQQSKNDERHFSRQYNHTFVVAKNKYELPDFQFKRTEEDNKNYKNPDNDPKGLWRSGDVRSPNFRKTLCFDIIAPDGKAIKAPANGWRWSEESIKEKINSGEIIFKNDNSGIIRKIYLCDQEGRIPENLWEGERFGSTRQAAALIKDIFDGKQVFDTPKPLQLLQRIIELFPQRNCKVLDFFAGSGTTLHATMQLNAEDGGHRQCILVTNNENNICEEVTYERNRRVIQGYTNAKGQQVEGLTNNNLRYYRVEHVARQNDNRTLRELMQRSTDLLCIKEGVYHEEREFAGLKFKPSVARYFHEGERRMLVIYNELAVAPIAAHVAECGATKEHPLKVYVFSNGRYAYEDELHAVATLVEVCAMPEALLQSMQSTLPPLHYGEEDYTPDAEAEALADNYNYKEEGGEA